MLAAGLVVNQPIAQFEVGDFRNFVYFILDWDARQAALVDSQIGLTEPLKTLGSYGFTLTSVLLTHTHHDHTAGLEDLLRAYPTLDVLVHKAEMHRLGATILPRCHPINDGKILSVGKIDVKVLHTPGHSAGACCFLVQTTQPHLLTGDTLFIRDCGRTDLETGSSREMFTSLQRLKQLTPSPEHPESDPVVLPGHHYTKECTSTLSRELSENPALKCASVAELEALP